MTKQYYRCEANHIISIKMQLYMTLLFFHAALTASPTNIALYKPTSQSSTIYGYRSSKAVDGKFFTSMGSGSCTQTNLQERPWWRVDLLESVDVWLVKITNRGDCCWDRLREFQIRVGNSFSGPDSNLLCDYSTDSLDRGVTEDFVCRTPRNGRYVYITVMTREILTLCEVEVYASDFTTISPTSLTGNIARGKPTSQSSNFFSCPNNNCRGNASRAVDGNRDATFDAESCTHTKYQHNPWWRVDLQKREVVRKVSLTNRGDCCAERLRNVEVRIGDDGCGYSNNALCKSFKGEVGLGITVDLYCNRRGRFLYVHLVDKDYLTLCEVQVFVEKGASLSWTKGQISCLSSRKSSASYAWIAGPVVAFFICCCCSRGRKKKSPQTAPQPAQNGNGAEPRDPPQSSNTSQDQTHNTPLEAIGFRENVRGQDDINKDLGPAQVWTIPTIPFSNPPPPSYEEAIQSNYANQAFEFESLSINPPYGSNVASAPPPAYPSMSRTQPFEHES